MIITFRPSRAHTSQTPVYLDCNMWLVGAHPNSLVVLDPTEVFSIQHGVPGTVDLQGVARVLQLLSQEEDQHLVGVGRGALC